VRGPPTRAIGQRFSLREPICGGKSRGRKDRRRGKAFAFLANSIASLPITLLPTCTRSPTEKSNGRNCGFPSRWGTSAYFLAAVAGGSLFNTAIKVAVHRARPVSELYESWSNFSFPSGHSTANAVLYGLLASLIGRGLPPAGRVTVAFAAAALITLIAFSRVYFGAHWFSDAAGGLAFAVTWLTVPSIAYQCYRPSEARTNGILAVTIIAVATAGGFK
jgi:membrane-associated phospholipid phosphatase